MKGAASIAYGKDVTMGEELVTKLNGDPSQNSTLAMDAVAEIGGTKFGIPPQSPDLNPIKNKWKLRKNAVQENIQHESYEDTMMSMEKGVVDNLIGSMNKRIDMVVKAKGQRIKYNNTNYSVNHQITHVTYM